jgi:hypothetical protein
VYKQIDSMLAVLLLAYGTVIILHRKLDSFRLKIEEIKRKVKVRVLILNEKETLLTLLPAYFSMCLFRFSWVHTAM